MKMTNVPLLCQKSGQCPFVFRRLSDMAPAVNRARRRSAQEFLEEMSDVVEEDIKKNLTVQKL